jgi:hypothetical protein
VKSKQQSLLNILLLILSSTSLSAQSVVSAGRLSGRVIDQSEAALPTTSVITRNLANGVEHSTRTDALGAFSFAALSPAAYSLTGSRAGFTDIQRIIRQGVHFRKGSLFNENTGR